MEYLEWKKLTEDEKNYAVYMQIERIANAVDKSKDKKGSEFKSPFSLF